MGLRIGGKGIKDAATAARRKARTGMEEKQHVPASGFRPGTKLRSAACFGADDPGAGLARDTSRSVVVAAIGDNDLADAVFACEVGKEQRQRRG